MDRQDGANSVQAEDHGQDAPQADRQGTDLLGLRRAHEMMSGKPVVVWIDSRFANRFPPFSGLVILTETLLKCLVQIEELASCTTLLVSDGNMSHAILLQPATETPCESPRLYFKDPWGPERGSFLEPGRNLAGVRARGEADGVYSITTEEAGRVLVAMLQQAPRGFGRARRKRYDCLTGTSLFEWFRLGEIGRGEASQGLTAVLCRPPRTGELIDLLFHVDPGGMVSAADLLLDASSVTTEAKLMAAADLAESLLKTLDAEPSSFTRGATLQLAVLIAGACAFQQPPADLLLYETRGTLQRVALDGRDRVHLHIDCDW